MLAHAKRHKNGRAKPKAHSRKPTRHKPLAISRRHHAPKAIAVIKQPKVKIEAPAPVLDDEEPSHGIWRGKKPKRKRKKRRNWRVKRRRLLRRRLNRNALHMMAIPPSSFTCARSGR